jgi:hypothetical protein
VQESILAQNPVPRIAVPRVNSGLVDERYELITLLFRFAGIPGMDTTDSDYQRLLNSTFTQYRNHNAVTTARQLDWQSVFLALKIEWNGNEWVYMDFHSPSNLERRFLAEVNDFYMVSGFGNFFDRHLSYYQEHTRRFNDNIGEQMNLAWFQERGGISADNIILTVSPSNFSSQAVYIRGETLADKLPFSFIRGHASTATYDDFRRYTWVTAHEISHSFGNIIGFDWYDRSSEFRGWAANANHLLPHDPRDNVSIGRELIADAFAYWYMLENTDYTLDQLFTYIPHMPRRYVEYVLEVIMGQRTLRFD